MILTCPACSTQYVVKDGAIPPGGRQVRCAACKHSWHQDAEPAEDGVEDDVMTSSDSAGSTDAPPADTAQSVEPDGRSLPREAGDDAEGGVEELPQGSLGEADYGLTAPIVAGRDPAPAPVETAAEWANADEVATDEDFGIPDMVDDEEPRGRGLRVMLILLLLVALAAAAFWFLAPAEIKARVGIAESGATPLEVMLTTSDRQKLASGNELLAISGRVINPTDREVAVPPIRAALRNKATRKLVYQWTIAPPARSLGPRSSASFNSAEVDIPEGGDELTVTLGDAAS